MPSNCLFIALLAPFSHSDIPFEGINCGTSSWIFARTAVYNSSYLAVRRQWITGSSDQTEQRLSTIGRIVKAPYRIYHQNEYLLHLRVYSLPHPKKYNSNITTNLYFTPKWIANCDDVII